MGRVEGRVEGEYIELVCNKVIVWYMRLIVDEHINMSKS